MRDQVFISYSRSDDRWLRRLQVYLAPLERRGSIRRWDDTLITPGQRWEDEIAAALARTRVAILLVSADFLASDFINGVELPSLLGAAESQGVLVIPLVLDHCNFERHPDLVQFQSVHSPRAPLETLPEVEQKAVLSRLAAAVEDALVDRATPAAPVAAAASRATVPVAARLVNLPARNPLFSGRAALLGALAAALDSHGRVALCGLPGVGKTETLIEFAHRQRTACQWIFWCRADSELQIVRGFCAIADALSLPEADHANQPATARAALDALASREDWLLIFDGADDLDGLRPWLPASSRAQVLISSRSAATGSLAEALDVDALALDEAVEFLLRRAKLQSAGSTADPHLTAAAREVAEATACLPLALDQAGAYVEETGCSLQEYGSIWRQHRRQLLDERGSGSLRQEASLWQAWSLSLQQLEAASAPAAELLRLLSFYHCDALPERGLGADPTLAGAVLGPALADPLSRNRMLREALRFAFLRRDAKTRRLSMHPMVQQFLLDGLAQDQRMALCSRALALLDASFPEPGFSNWADCDALAAHGLSVLDHAAALGLPAGERARLSGELGFYLVQRVRFAQALPLVTDALALRRQPPLVPPGLARALVIAGQLQLATGEFDAAHVSFQEAVDLLADSAPSLLQVIALERLASADLELGRPETSERQLLQALAAAQAAGAGHSAAAAQCINNLGALHFRRGDVSAARTAFAQAADMRQQVLPAQHPSIAQSCNNLGAACMKLGELDAARDGFAQALALREAALGNAHPQVAESLLNLGLLELKTGDLSGAREQLQRAAAIQLACRGPLHPELAKVQMGLAQVSLDQGLLDDAQQLFTQVHRSRVQVLGAGHEDSARALMGLADVATARGDEAEAARLLGDGLAVLRRALGADHPQVQAAERELAQLRATSADPGEPLPGSSGEPVARAGPV